MFKVNNESELLTLLKIISEEAVIASKKVLNEKDNYADNFKSRVDSDMQLFKEEEEEEEPEEGEDVESPKPKDDPEEGDEESSLEKSNMPAKDKAAAMSSENFGVSFQAVMTAINTLRAGRSLKDSDIRDSLSVYYERLDEDERKILLLFLRELSKILTGAIPGQDAQDPGEDPFNFDLIIKGKEAEKEKKSIDKPTPKIQSPDKKIKKPGAGAEDTSPPIKLGETQDLSEIRKKVRHLMNS